MKNIEILSPAGSFEALKAAVQSGADAVYIGGHQFSARAFAGNFDRDELAEAVRYAHIRDVMIYVTVNTLVKEAEIESFMEYADFLYESDVDALILQDLGMACELKRRYPDLELHASTQMSAHSLEDVKFLEEMGFSRVVLARELSADEIKNISAATDVQLEVFVHGALCVSYSGQCLMSSMIGGRSGNRGRCAQPCRKEYELLDLKNAKKVDAEGMYIMSPKDICTVEEIEKIIGSGAKSLKIEGRMKKPEYVAATTDAYKRAAQAVIEGRKADFAKSDAESLKAIFNRGFTKGYMFNEVNAGIINAKSQGNKGIRVATVEYLDRGRKKLGLKLEKSIAKGDGLSPGGIVGRVIVGTRPTNEADAGQVVELDYIGNASKGDVVYRTSDARLLKKMQDMYEGNAENRKTSIDIEFVCKIGKPPEMWARDDRGNSVHAKGSKNAEPAVNVPITNEKALAQIQKLGGTPYEIGNAKIEIQDGLSIPVKAINEMRRDITEQLDSLRAVLHTERSEKAADGLKAVVNADDPGIGNKSKQSASLKLRVKAYSLEQLSKILELKDIAYVEAVYFECNSGVQKAVQLCREKGIRIICSLPRIMRTDEYSAVEAVNGSGADGFCAAAYGQIRAIGENARLYCDYSFNVFNSLSANVLAQHRAESVCISPELNLADIKSAASGIGTEVEALVYGRIPLMTSEYCPVGTFAGDCRSGRDSRKCINSGDYALRDKMGEEFPIRKLSGCKSVIYNSKTLCMLDKLSDVERSGIQIARIDLACESAQNVKEIVDAHIQTIKNGFEIAGDAAETYSKLRSRGITNGHYYRGVE